jgi:hypothetical protein
MGEVTRHSIKTVYIATVNQIPIILISWNMSHIQLNWRNICIRYVEAGGAGKLRSQGSHTLTEGDAKGLIHASDYPGVPSIHILTNSYK